MGDSGKADESFHRALQLAPHDGDTMHNYGWFLCQQRRFDEAQAQFQQALAQPQYRAQVHVDLAASYYERGQMAIALDELNEALKLEPNNAKAYNIMGLIHTMLGEDDKARRVEAWAGVLASLQRPFPRVAL